MNHNEARKYQELPITFLDVPRHCAGHFSLHFYAAIFWLIHYLHLDAENRGEDVDSVLTEHPFLASYFAEIRRRMPQELTWSEGPDWWQNQIGVWEKKAAEYLPLVALGGAAREFGRRIGFVLAGLVEEDSRFGTLFTTLQSPLPHRRPTFELLTQITRVNRLSNGSHPPYNDLIHEGLLLVDNQDAPRAEWLLRVAPRLWDIVQAGAAGQPLQATPVGDQVEYFSPDEFATIEDLVVTDEVRTQLAHLVVLIQTQQVETVVLRATPGNERIRTVGALVRSLGCGLIVTEGSASHPNVNKQLGPLCLLTNSIPVFIFDLNPGETAALPRLAGYRGPIGVLMGHEGGLSGTALQRSVTISLGRPGPIQRHQLWHRAFGDHPVEHLNEISARFHLPDGYIRQVAGVAVTTAALNGRQQITMNDVREACRTLNRQKLDTLATYLSAVGSWNHLVVGEIPGEKLRELETRCRHRERLLEHLGPAFQGNANRGVRALFNGPSGTGKTLAAKILSAELGMDLYRVDLAAVVNKYIGETEKNLHQILSHAEELDVVLLLDEGDSLLGSRTDVKSANDRYANLETNFLLQRLEHYEGIVLITTNVGEHIDTAFQRRMDVVINFAPPREEERWHIWQLHLPEDHAVTPIYLETVSLRCVLTGGQIRNAALHASLLALEEGGDAAKVTDQHLAQAIRSEYRKSGASFPLVDVNHQNGHSKGMATFLEKLRS